VCVARWQNSIFQVIPCPEDLKDDYDSVLGDEVETDGPNVVTSRDGNMAINFNCLIIPLIFFSEQIQNLLSNRHSSISSVFIVFFHCRRSCPRYA
jgi:hypothetical protein